MENENIKVNKSKALEKLRELTEQITHLSTLRYNNQEFKSWLTIVKNFLKDAFNYDDYQQFVNTKWYSDTWSVGEEEYQRNYKNNLSSCKTTLVSILNKHEVLDSDTEAKTMPKKYSKDYSEIPKVFIAHGGETKSRIKLQKYLIALGTQPLIIEEEPKEGRSVNEQVEYYMNEADCAIILGTGDDKDLKDGRLYPRRNVHIEIGRVQEKFPKKIIYLLEEGASFPSDISEKLYTRFTQENMDEAFISTARELKAFRILKAVKPQSNRE